MKNEFSGLSDTSSEAEKVQVALLRKAGSSRRTSIAISLSQTAFALSQRAIRRANPDISDFEAKILFLKYCHGEELAKKVEKVMIEKGLNAINNVCSDVQP